MNTIRLFWRHAALDQLGGDGDRDPRPGRRTARPWPGSSPRCGARQRRAGTCACAAPGTPSPPIAATDGHAIDLGRFTGVESADRGTGLVRVRAGTTLRQLNRELDDAGLAMTNLGDIDAQTIAGALSTGTHGTGAALGGLATQVESLDLLLADGSTLHCSADGPTRTCSPRPGSAWEPWASSPT